LDISSIGSNSPQAVSNRLVHRPPSPAADLGEREDFSGTLGGLMTLNGSSAATGKPEASAGPSPAVTQAMSDLVSDQKDVPGDLSQLKSFFAQSPQGLSTFMSALQGGASASSSSEIGLAPTRSRTDDRQSQAVARYLAEAQRADARELEQAQGDGRAGVISLFG
jgi:hypothetical protein